MTSLFDIQVNGFAGVDFQQPDLTASDLVRATTALATHQTERYFLTLITDTIDSLCAKLRHLERLRSANPLLATAICGYHLEGPWLSPEPGYRGAHDASRMSPPSITDFDRLHDAASGHLKLITLAPELPDSIPVIRHATAAGTHVSIGHSDASDDDISAAIGAGCRFATHLGNGVPNDLHRHHNVTQRLLARDELTAFFIPDGIHVPPFVLQNLFRAKPPGGALFTSDCMAAAGAPPGSYTLGACVLEVGEDRVVRLPGHANFAGSALAPDEGLANVQRWLSLSPSNSRHLFSTAIADHFQITLPTIAVDGSQ